MKIYIKIFESKKKNHKLVLPVLWRVPYTMDNYPYGSDATAHQAAIIGETEMYNNFISHKH